MDSIFCQETEIGKNKPWSIATSTSKIETTRWEDSHSIHLVRPFPLKFCNPKLNSCNNCADIPSVTHSFGNEDSGTIYTHIQVVHSDKNVTNKDNPPENRQKLFCSSEIGRKKSSKQHLISNRRKHNQLRRKNTPFFHLILASLTLYTYIGPVSCTEFKVLWNMKTSPAIIGNDVVLECVFSNDNQSCDEYPRQWYGGVNYGLLCQDGMCRNKTKYRELPISSCKHHLVIYNFTEKDLNQDYTCSYGISNDRKGLTLKNGLFELHPSNEAFTEAIKMSVDSISVHLQLLKVYPKPRCSFQYEDTNITKYVNVSVEKVSYFFKVNLTLDYTINDQCEGELLVSCIIGSSWINTSKNCQGESPESRLPILTIVGISVAVLVFVPVSCVVLLCYKSRRSERKLNRCLMVQYLNVQSTTLYQ